MKKILVIVLLISLVVLSGCRVVSKKDFIFEDTDNVIFNEIKCQELCEKRAMLRNGYKCDRYPVSLCDDGVCLCQTY